VRSELALRICSAALLIPLAIGVAYVGGRLFALFWAAAALITLAEWTMLVSAARSGKRTWLAFGVLYSAAIAAPAIILRADEQLGFVAIIFLFAIVWATDTAAYLIGRRVGGPKLLPLVSPSKTWAGALAGLMAAMLAAAVVAKAAALSPRVLVMLGLVFSACAQAGDLFESWVKRRFGAKNSGRLIPGHGGLMDRLDGFMAAALVAALIGVLRGGIAAPGRGLLIW
jgi:phosphatidate cytidylyltransferase